MKKKILVVDDELTTCVLLEHFLSSQYEVFTTNSVVEALTWLESNLPDLIISDIQMPKMDGYKAFELLKSKLDADVPIIACTVHTNEMETTRDLGFTGFVSKPLDVTRFKQQLARILNQQPVWDVD